MTKPRRRKKFAAGAAAVLGAAFVPEAAAAVITVNSATDIVADDSDCTLREALDNANADLAVHDDCTAGTGLDTIDFNLTFPATIVLGGTSLPISDPVVIDGPGQTDLVIDADGLSRIFEIVDGDSSTNFAASIDDLTLTGGDATSEALPGGGAILNAEDLTLTNVLITGNTAAAGGGILNYSDGLLPASLTVVDSTFTANSSGYGGAIFSGNTNVDISGSTLNLNNSSCCGGAISQTGGDFTLTDSSVTENTSLTAGGITLYYTGAVVLTNATISGNDATGGDAGGLYIYGATTSITIEDSIISGNEAAGNAGGVKIAAAGECGCETPVYIRDTEISGNIAGNGAGGLYLYDTGAVTIERTKIIDNTAAAYNGGAAFWGVTAHLVESQVTGNEAPTAGGLYAGYGTYLYIVNSTIANNTATTGSVGGIGINSSYAFIDLTTISGNTAPNGAGGNVFVYGSQFYMSHSIIANGEALTGPDLVTSSSTAVINFTLIEDPTGASFTGTDNITNDDPELGPLQDNGGPTETMLPALTSPVIDAGSPEFAGPNNDQRGFTRPINIVDLGAVEVNPGVLGLSSDAYSVNEGDGFATITVNRTGGSDGEVSVNYLTTSGSAIAGADFTTTNGTLTWASGDMAPKTFNVPIADDPIFEGNEQFTVSLDTVAGATLGTSSALVTIVDNDPVPAISIDDQSVTEGGLATFNVTLSNPTTQTVTVQFSTAGVTATSGTDFTANGGTVTFVPGDVAETVTVQTTADTTDEANETFNVTLSVPENATIFDGTGLGTINDDDPTPQISIDDQGVTEGGLATFNVTLSNPSDQTITVDFATAGVTATSGTDFTANSGTVTFAPGDTAETVTVQTTADTTDEPSETFNVTLSNPNASGTILDGTGTGTIADDDPTPTISIDDQGVTEGGLATFNVTLSNPSADPITVDFATAGVTATSGTDFTPNSGTVTFVPGDVAETVTVQTTADTTDEANETFTVTLSNANPAATILDGTGDGTINDDDPTPAISIDDQTVTEGGLATFNVTLSNPSDQPITVDFATSGVSATSGDDFTPNSGTVTFVPGDVAETVTVQTTEDPTDEPNETFEVTLSNPSVTATILDGTGTGTIADNDGLPSIFINDVPVTEGDLATFTVSLSNPSTDPVTVNFTTSGISATSGDDFTPNSGIVTFAPGDTSEPVTVQTVEDSADEPNETFSVTLTNPSATATLLDDAGVGTINDDDALPVAMITDVTQAEDSGNFVFTVTLTPASGQTVTIDFATQDVSANAGSDYTANSGTLTFVPGDTSETITVAVSADAISEPDETFNVILSNAPLATIGDNTGVGTILNDDAEVADLSVTKTAGTGPFTQGGTATFTITVSNAGPDTATNVTVTDILPDGTSFVSASGSCTGTTTVTCNVGTLANGGETTITLTVQLNRTGEITNTATAASDAADASPAAGDATIVVGGPAAVAPIPTASEWALMALASALAAVAALKLKR